MSHPIAAVLAGLGLLLVRPSDAATEMEQREEISAAAERGFLGGDFDELERVSSAYRLQKSRTSSGIWKLTVFYAGIENAVQSIAGEQDGTDAYDSLEARVKGWVAKYPDSPAGHIVLSVVLVKRAWAHRGDDFAINVSEAAWARFRQYISAARANLEKHKDVASRDPKWYEVMLLVARAEGWDPARFQELLDEAVDREPVFYETYFSAFYNFLPKWGGSLDEIEELAQYAVRRTHHLEGRGMYARIYWFASQTEFSTRLFDNSLADWPQMRAGFEDVVSRYPDAWNLVNYARFACMARDKATTAELMQHIGSSVAADVWHALPSHLQCAEWASRP